MTNLPRVEITEKALKILKIETALSGLGQKGTLEALVIRGASTQSLALVDEKAIIPKVESMPLMEVEEKEIEPQIPLDHDLSMKALEYILDELEAGHEPLLADVATKLNTTTQKLGKALSKVNVKATETRRAGIAGRYFTLDMKEQIVKANHRAGRSHP